MLLLIQFSFITLLIAILLLAPLVLYILRENRSEISTEPIEPVDNPSSFDDLAPVDDAEQSEAYLKSLRWALGNRNVRNIALTGPYGSGKSSLLATFKKNYPNDFEYLNISLASFTDGNPDIIKKNDTAVVVSPVVVDGTETKQSELQERHKNEAQQLIELSVLQQIFYKVDQADIPDSRFKRISLVRKEDLNYFVAGVFAFVTGILSFVFPAQLKKLSVLNDFYVEHPDAWFILTVGLLIPGLIWLTKNVFRFFRSSGLKKLNISSGEIEIDPKSEGSILNKYFDELVYFFSATKFNVVLIEDMDRFNDPEIFTKLRELNNLLNNSSQIQRRIVFVYAIKDNLFVDERTRTKFFDFIVPVIPIINWSNSLQKLKDKLDAAGFEIEPRFITSITLYIDDMRVLKNIFNELLLYNQTLQIPKERQTKLLAMIAYKNMHPNDFADLHEERGMVFDTFKKAQAEREEIVKNLDTEIAAKEKQISDAKGLLPYNIKELRAAYIQAIVDKLSSFSYFYINSERQSFSDVQEDEHFNTLKTGKDIRYVGTTTGNSLGNYKFEDIEKKVAPGTTYDEREAAVKNKNAAAISKLEKELAHLKANRTAVAAYSVTEVIRHRLDQFPDLSETKTENRLLRYLLSEGYVDVSYPYLISYFYPGAIGRADLKFLTYVNDRIALPFEYVLEKPAGLIEMLADYDFEKDAILNISLLDELLSRRAVLTAIGDKVMEQLNTEKDRVVKFVAAYVEKGGHIAIFIKLLCKQWPGIFNYFLFKEDDALIAQYLKLILAHAELEDLELINIDRHLEDYLDDHFDEIANAVSGLDLPRIGEMLEKLQTRFVKLNPNLPDQTLFDLAYVGDHYVIAFDNIKSIIEKKNSKAINLNELSQANYSTLVAADTEQLYNYIDQDKDIYVKNVLLKLGDNLTDAEKDVVDLLNDEDIELENKKMLIAKEIAVIANLDEVDNTDLYPSLLTHSRISPSWQNILRYFNDSIDESLLKFLNSIKNAEVLGATTLEPNRIYEKKQTDALELALIRENRLTTDAYRAIIAAFIVAYQDLDTTPLDSDKVENLIYDGLLDLSTVNYNRVKANNSPLHVDFLIENLDAYLDDLEEYDVDNNDRLLILKDGNLTRENQLKLIATFTPEIIRSSAGLATRIIEILLASGKLGLDEEKLKALVATATGEYGKVVLLEHHIRGLDTSVIRELLNGIGGEYKRLNAGKRPQFPANDLHKSLAPILQDKGIISSFKPIDDEHAIKMVGRGV